MTTAPAVKLLGVQFIRTHSKLQVAGRASSDVSKSQFHNTTKVHQMSTFVELAPHEYIKSITLAARLQELLPTITKPIPRVSTGWPLLDACMRDEGASQGGFVVPSANVIGAPPKEGKSLWSQITMERWCKTGWGYYCDFENGVKRFAWRLAMRLSKLSSKELERKLDDKEQARQRRMIRWFEKGPGRHLVLEDQRQMTPVMFEERISALCEIADGDPVLCVVDSIQKLPLNLADRRGAIDEWLRKFEQVRDDYNCIMLMVSELGRPDSSKKQYVVTGNKFKESGDIEYTCDSALTFSPVSQSDDSSWLDVQYNRDGWKARVAKYIRKPPYFEIIEQPLES